MKSKIVAVRSASGIDSMPWRSICAVAVVVLLAA